MATASVEVFPQRLPDAYIFIAYHSPKQQTQGPGRKRHGDTGHKQACALAKAANAMIAAPSKSTLAKYIEPSPRCAFGMLQLRIATSENPRMMTWLRSSGWSFMRTRCSANSYSRNDIQNICCITTSDCSRIFLDEAL